MKNLITIIFLLSAFLGNAQTMFDVANAEQTEVPMKGESVFAANTPYVGASLLYNIRDEVDNSFLFDGRAAFIAYEAYNFALPIVTNISLTEDSTNLDAGVSLDIAPWYMLSSADDFRLLAHARAGYLFKNRQDSEENEFRFFVGFQAALFNNNGLPFTLSVAPEFTLNNGDWRSALGVSAVIPIAPTLGFLVEASHALSDDAVSSFAAGVMINTRN